MKRNLRGLLYNSENEIKIKDYFIMVADIIRTDFDGNLLDIGCSNGSFLKYLRSRFPVAKLSGLEYLQELVTAFDSQGHQIVVQQDDISNLSKKWARYDVITMLGVLGIFDDYELVLQNSLSLLKPGGTLILHGLFNEYDLNVSVKYAYSEEPKTYHSGWNILSIRSLEECVVLQGARVESVRDFCIQTDIEKQADPVRSWTETHDGLRQIYNGLHLRQPQKIIVIKKQ